MSAGCRTDGAGLGFVIQRAGLRRDDASGALVAEGLAARTGVQAYPSGLEFRPASEVFDGASLATWEGLPLVIGHPGEVTSANWKSMGVVGYVRAVRRDGDFVRATLVFHDDATIVRVLRQELAELSGGYSVELVNGTQTRIRMNHLALLPEGQARAGVEARVLL